MCNADRRSGVDRRSVQRPGPDRRVNGLKNIWECVYHAIRGIYDWTDLPAKGGETRLWQRNWRSWFGHATVATDVVAFGRWLGMHLYLISHALGFWTEVIFAAGVGLFYFWREYGVGGDYWKRKKGYDSKSDSVLDFWVVLPPIVILMQVARVYAFVAAFVMSVAIYALSRKQDE